MAGKETGFDVTDKGLRDKIGETKDQKEIEMLERFQRQSLSKCAAQEDEKRDKVLSDEKDVVVRGAIPSPSPQPLESHVPMPLLPGDATNVVVKS